LNIRKNTRIGTKAVVGSQIPLTVSEERVEPSFPSTRYQGSKNKLAGWIWDTISNLEFDTALDLFGGTGCVSHMLKRKGKAVTYNDSLTFNYLIGLALIENDGETLTDGDIDYILTRNEALDYPSFISDTFNGIFYLDSENAWLDMAITNIRVMTNRLKQALAYFALFQAALIKRPFNLFHRSNLYLRLQDVERSFGNKTSWDRPFEDRFRFYAKEANSAIFCNGRDNHALNLDWRDVPPEHDLVYIDPPYLSAKGVGVDYLDFYHFLEGIARYDEWPRLVDFRRKHRPLIHESPEWSDPNRIHGAFSGVFERFADSILVVSYRSDGIPTDGQLVGELRRYKRNVIEVKRRPYRYVLSRNNLEEVLIIGR